MRKLILSAAARSCPQRRIAKILKVRVGMVQQSNTIILQVGLNSVRTAVLHRKEEWHRPAAREKKTLLTPSIFYTRTRKREGLAAFIQEWVHDHTTAFSNVRNIVNYIDFDQHKESHVIHWQVETVQALFIKCKLEAIRSGFQPFEVSFLFFFFKYSLTSIIKLISVKIFLDMSDYEKNKMDYVLCTTLV